MMGQFNGYADRPATLKTQTYADVMSNCSLSA